MSIIRFPGRVPMPDPGFPVDDHDRHAGPYAMQHRDRDVYDVDLVEAQDDSRDQWVTLPVKAVTRNGEPVIEIGRYSLTLDDAAVLAVLVRKYVDNFQRHVVKV